MKLTCLTSALAAAALGISSFAAFADVPPPRDVPFEGTVQINVDATDVAHRIFRVHEVIPAQPGPLTLLYPQWLPGNHSPTGPIDKLAGLVVTANGKTLPWKRDTLNVYAFHVDVPAGASSVEVAFQFLSPQEKNQGRVVMTPEMLNLQWNASSLYPAGYATKGITAQTSVKFPAGWQFGSALEVASRDGDTVHFKPISYDNLVDSPIYAGKYFKRVDLDPGAKVPVHLNIVADAPKYLEITPEQLKVHRNLVQQMYKLYGARHYNHYDFLFSLSDKMSGNGLEHHRSSENGVGTGYFTEWDKNVLDRDLLPHEFNHSWDGKYRRGADLTTPSFNVPMEDSLLWVYEGQTQFWGFVMAARSGLWSEAQTRDALAEVAARYDRGRPGLASWRNLQDTTNDPIIAQRAPLPYRNYQASEDYYSGGQMIWLDVDAKLRDLSRGKHSIDDFAKAFFGMNDGDWGVNTYVFEDVVKTLNDIQPYDWNSYLRTRLDGHGPLIGGVEGHGWKLVYDDKPSDMVKAIEARRHSADLTYSIGLSIGKSGAIGDVLWDSPAFKAGISPGMTVVAVNNHEYDADALKDAITAAAKDKSQPVELLVKNFDEYKTVRIDYHGGLKYPHLVRDDSKPDTLGKLLKAR
ncbi:peptidase M61 [Rhodanobacter sp. Root627]|uniref:Peptidase M61 domain-containing protein n=1 Tax=Rhodanobacter fulvus Jip2 TaxID=1163408 RepID=I4VQT2_9GAMM|nr:MULTISPECIES: M61 family metallopeptidase [Rhodanobacter]EIL89573.1 peptidase M61 domain-containing protein [Rhodanobacter fulvus Jip2]KRA31829.1 peptidase M61 [Rhodanobacter sp. Root627]